MNKDKFRAIQAILRNDVIPYFPHVEIRSALMDIDTLLSSFADLGEAPDADLVHQYPDDGTVTAYVRKEYADWLEKQLAATKAEYDQYRKDSMEHQQILHDRLDEAKRRIKELEARLIDVCWNGADSEPKQPLLTPEQFDSLLALIQCSVDYGYNTSADKLAAAEAKARILLTQD